MPDEVEVVVPRRAPLGFELLWSLVVIAVLVAAFSIVYAGMHPLPSTTLASEPPAVPTPKPAPAPVQPAPRQ